MTSTRRCSSGHRRATIGDYHWDFGDGDDAHDGPTASAHLRDGRDYTVRHDGSRQPRPRRPTTTQRRVDRDAPHGVRHNSSVARRPRIEELRRRVERDPASIAFAQLAEEYRRAGDYDEAVRVCRAGLAQHPAYLSARVTLGRALLELQQFDEAQAELEHVLQPRPTTSPPSAPSPRSISGAATSTKRSGSSAPRTPSARRSAPPAAPRPSARRSSARLDDARSAGAVDRGPAATAIRLGELESWLEAILADRAARARACSAMPCLPSRGARARHARVRAGARRARASTRWSSPAPPTSAISTNHVGTAGIARRSRATRCTCWSTSATSESVRRCRIAAGVSRRCASWPVPASYDEALLRLPRRVGVGDVGFEAAHLTVARLRLAGATLRGARLRRRAALDRAGRRARAGRQGRLRDRDAARGGARG